jgi:hypothetical protein
VSAKWRPIRTAPMDGTRVLVADKNAAGSWVEAAYYSKDGEYEGWFMVNTHWTDAVDGQIFPTVWMPMPEPPTRNPRP